MSLTFSAPWWTLVACNTPCYVELDVSYLWLTVLPVVPNWISITCVASVTLVAYNAPYYVELGVSHICSLQCSLLCQT